MSKEPRRFVCTFDGCNKSFNRRDYLERHAANHLPVKPFYCEPCHRYFARGDLYENHLSTKFHIKRSSGTNVSRGNDSANSHHPKCSPVQPSPPHLSSPYNGLASQQTVHTGHTVQTIVGNSGASLGTPLMSQSPCVMETSSPSMPSTTTTPNYQLRPLVPSTTPVLTGIVGLQQSSQQIIPDSLMHLTQQPPRRTSSSQGSYFEKSSTNSPLQNDSTNLSYNWLFEDRDFELCTDQDRLYSYYLDSYRKNCDQYWRTSNFKHSCSIRNLVSRHMTDQVIQILRDEWRPSFPADDNKNGSFFLSKTSDYPKLSLSSPQGDINELLKPLNLNETSITYFIDIVWSNIESVIEFVHRASFDPNKKNPILVAAFVILGISLNEDPNIKIIARYLYTPVLIALRNELAARKFYASNNTFEEIGLLQAYGILLRFDNLICGLGDRDEVHGVISGKWLIARYRSLLVPTPGEKCFEVGQNLLQTLKFTDKGFEFIDKPGQQQQPSDLEAQWLEWIGYESCKRSAMFVLYCDGVHTLSCNSASSHLTIFDVDTHMPCAPSLWFATTYQEFHAIVGSPRVVLSVPYLHVLKSILRLPRLGEDTDPHPYCNAWPLFPQCCILYGLLSVARAMNNTTATQQELISMLNSRDNTGSLHVNYLDRGIQTRISRGFDIWTQYFEASTALSENHHPFVMSENKIENVNIIGHLQTIFNSGIFMDYILLLLLHYHSCYILMHEDLRLILNVANELPFWLVEDPQPVLNHIDFSVYEKWAKASDTKMVVSVATIFLVRLTAGHRVLLRQRSENQLLGLVTYYAVLIIWLYDKALHPIAESTAIIEDPTSESCASAIINESTVYLYYIWSKTNNKTNAPQLIARPSVGASSVIALGALLLKDTQIGQPLTGGRILHNLYKRLFFGYHYYQL